MLYGFAYFSDPAILRKKHCLNFKKSGPQHNLPTGTLLWPRVLWVPRAGWLGDGRGGAGAQHPGRYRPLHSLPHHRQALHRAVPQDALDRRVNHICIDT